MLYAHALCAAIAIGFSYIMGAMCCWVLGSSRRCIHDCILYLLLQAMFDVASVITTRYIVLCVCGAVHTILPGMPATRSKLLPLGRIIVWASLHIKAHDGPSSQTCWVTPGASRRRQVVDACRGESGWCLDMTSTHGARRHAWGSIPPLRRPATCSPRCSAGGASVTPSLFAAVMSMTQGASASAAHT